ncbi:MAG: hypothetical protein BWY42_00527 [Candidatus Omnitrophica bacterium ADurb.Bin277]|nr:MAG: hypothetical protein BWY42_00527 [Candidatus Omnitrophica bacterium ADurb.Bin277]
MLVFPAKQIGLAMTGLGLAIFISPGFTQKIFDFMKRGKRIYWAGVARCLAGLVLILIVSKSALPVAAVMISGLIWAYTGYTAYWYHLESFMK